jgi:hypothetical protein
MPADVIIDPTNGQIYWNDGTGSPQSISIKGDALNAISFVGYSGSYSPGSAPGGAQTLATFNDSSVSTLVPGTTNYELGSGTLRWKFYGSTGDFSSNTISSNLVSGAVLINGGIAISGNASIGQSLNFYNTSNINYIGFKAGATSANTLYTLPTAFPATGTSVLQSTDLGIMSWVGVIGTATTARNINVVSATTSASHPLLFTPVSGSASGAAVSSNNTLVYNPNTDILSVSGFAVTSGVDSTSTTTGAFQIKGGIGITGNAFIGGTINLGSPLSIPNGGTNASSFGQSAGFIYYDGTSVRLLAASGATINYTNGYYQFDNRVYASSFFAGGNQMPNGSGIAGRVTIWSGNNTIGSDAEFTYDSTNNILTVLGNINAIGVTASGLAVTNTTASTSITSGAFVVTGGAAVGQTLSVGGSLNIFNGANYSGLRFSGSASTTYTLPPRTPTGTATSYLSSSIDGVMAWVAAPTSGGPSGTINSSTIANIAYYSAATTLSGDSVAGNYFQYTGDSRGLVIANVDAEFFTTTGSTKLLTVGTGATNYSTNRKALAVVSTNNAWTDGDLLVLGVGNLAANIRFGVDWTGRVQIGTPGTGFTLPATNGTSGQVLTANTDGKATWTTVTGSSGAGSGTVAIPGGQYQVAAYYHSATGASVSGSTTFTNNTSTEIVNITHATSSLSTSTGALVVAGGVGIGGSLYIGKDVVIRSQNDLVLWNTTNTQYTSLQAGNTSNSYTLSFPPAPVGAGASVIVTGSDGLQYFAAPGAGIAFSSATANTPLIRAKRPVNLQFSSGFTPLAAGPDNVILRIPELYSDGTTVVTYNLRRFQVRVETPSAGTSRLQLERSSTDTGAFTLAASGSSHIGGFGVTISGAGIYLTSVTTFSGSLVTSGNLLRLNWTLLNATHANFMVNLLLEEV